MQGEATHEFVKSLLSLSAALHPPNLSRILCWGQRMTDVTGSVTRDVTFLSGFEGAVRFRVFEYAEP